MNKYQYVASKIFTSDFLFMLASIPTDNKLQKRIGKLTDQIGQTLDGKVIGDCLLALTEYLSFIIVNNNVDLDESIEFISKLKGNRNTENYIM